MKTFINILLSFVFLAACSYPAPQSKVAVYAGFPETRELQGEVIPLDTALFRYPFRIRVQDDIAVLIICMEKAVSAMSSAIRTSATCILSAGAGRLPKRCFPLRMSGGTGTFCGL